MLLEMVCTKRRHSVYKKREKVQNVCKKIEKRKTGKRKRKKKLIFLEQDKIL